MCSILTDFDKKLVVHRLSTFCAITVLTIFDTIQKQVFRKESSYLDHSPHVIEKLDSHSLKSALSGTSSATQKFHSGTSRHPDRVSKEFWAYVQYSYRLWQKISRAPFICILLHHCSDYFWHDSKTSFPQRELLSRPQPPSDWETRFAFAEICHNCSRRE